LIISKLAINSKNSLLFLLNVKNNIITFEETIRNYEQDNRQPRQH